MATTNPFGKATAPGQMKKAAGLKSAKTLTKPAVKKAGVRSPRDPLGPMA
jgi:hypothetical protein